MRIAVKDANVLIDLVDAGILELWFGLGIETHTTDLVWYEIREPKQREQVGGYVMTGQLRMATLSPEEIMETQAEALRLRVSLADASALSLARKLDAALLFGDMVLRNAARAAGIEVRGVLWVFDCLVDGTLLTPGNALVCLRRLIDCGSFLPAAECAERIRRWELKGRQ